MNTNHFRRSLETTFPQQTVFLLSTHRPRCTFLSHTLHNQGEQSDPTGSSSPVCIKQNNNPDKGRPAQASLSCRCAWVAVPAFVSPMAPLRGGATYIHPVMISQCRCTRCYIDGWASAQCWCFPVRAHISHWSSKGLFFRAASGSPGQSLKALGLSPVRSCWNLS